MVLSWSWRTVSSLVIRTLMEAGDAFTAGSFSQAKVEPRLPWSRCSKSSKACPWVGVSCEVKAAKTWFSACGRTWAMIL